MRGLLLFGCLSGAACLSGACAAATSGPAVLSIPDVRAPPVRSGELIMGYDLAVVSIAAIMERDLGLPKVQASLYFYSNRTAFRTALEGQGYTPEFARDAAATLSGIGGFRRVLLNDQSLRWLEWPYRIGLLAHELTHTVQYEFSGGRRSTSEQWLREGFAEWVEVSVLEALDLTTWEQARSITVQRVRDAARRGSLPTFPEMVTYPDWVRVIMRGSEEGVYAQALMAVDLLISRHGRDAAIDYFRLFAESEDRLANFQSAFGEELSAFDRAFREHLARTLR
jgi:hypothetical protein